MNERIKAELLSIADNFKTLASSADAVLAIAGLCADAIRNGNKILFCGNGGSAADSQHLAAELVGRFQKDRPGMAAIALTVDTSVLTAVSNDYGFEGVFARQVESLGRKGDVLIGLSTSGNSPNVVKALVQAKVMGLKTVALTGMGGGECGRVADRTLAVPAKESAHIQEMHIAVGHLICGEVEQAIYG